jgi:hypothetical protein
MILFRIRRKFVGVAPTHANTLLSGLAPLGVNVLGPQFVGKDVFIPSNFNSIRTPNDVVFYAQQFFDEIKAIYVKNNPNLPYVGGFVGEDHTGVVGDPVYTQDQMKADGFVKVVLTPNGTIRLYCSAIFTQFFYLETHAYGKKILGLPDQIVAFRRDPLNALQILTGITALTNNTAAIVAGVTQETAILQCTYPLTRHFDHRMRIEIDSGGMPIPAITTWTTSNKQAVRHTLASFDINQTYRTSISLNNIGGNQGDHTFESTLLLGDLIWRRAEDRISERYEILNSQFFQNILLEIYMVRREWDRNKNEFTFVRRRLNLVDGESWSAKLRFRTLNK